MQFEIQKNSRAWTWFHTVCSLAQLVAHGRVRIGRGNGTFVLEVCINVERVCILSGGTMDSVSHSEVWLTLTYTLHASLHNTTQLLKMWSSWWSKCPSPTAMTHTLDAQTTLGRLERRATNSRSAHVPSVFVRYQCSCHLV